MSKIAIDVVLLPPEDIMDKAIDINKHLADDPIQLDKENCLPHVSLCMGVVDEKNLPKIKAIIDEIGKHFSALSLTIDKINAEKYCCFDVTNTEDLQRLHETIMTELLPSLSYDALPEMCFSPPVAAKTLFWINEYRGQSSFENFYPHITLGTTPIKNKTVNIPFTASKLAICHLGNYCTCRKILHTVTLV